VGSLISSLRKILKDLDFSVVDFDGLLRGLITMWRSSLCLENYFSM
jgi:hypothetical protein